MKLYSYWKSSASWRVRIALGLKELDFELVSVDLRGGAQTEELHLARNPLAQVPVLALADGRLVSQSMAIFDYLEAVHPAPSLYPCDPHDRARAIQLAEAVNAGIQPLQNLATRLRVTETADPVAWCRHFVGRGLQALEAMASTCPGRFLVGDHPTVADLCLVPQLESARGFGLDPADFPTLSRVESTCGALPAFRAARPEAQPDAPRRSIPTRSNHVQVPRPPAHRLTSLLRS